MADAITLQIVRNRVASLMQEMHYHFYRSGYSTIIRESKDFSCAILDETGRLLVAPPMFFHAPVYRHFCGYILDHYGKEGIADGDVFVCNHPYEGGLPHVSDMGFVAPIFADGALVGFSGAVAHKADVGGTNPGSTSPNATELYHEGLLLPPVRIVRKGQYNADLERVILANSRQPRLVKGDMLGQIACVEMGVKRTKDMCEKLGSGEVREAFQALLKGAAAELDAAIRALPDGQSSAEGFMDSDGVDNDTPVRFACTVTVKGGRMTIDLSNCAPQTRGPINLRPSMVEACVFYSLIGALDPQIYYNDGMRDVVDIVVAPNTVTNASPPAPVSNYQSANLKLVDVILEALAHFRPERAIANAGASGALLIQWKGGGRPGQASMQYEILGSAYGGGKGYDGCTAVATHLSNLHNTPIEIIESEFPCRITDFDIVADSAGAGENRGGLAFRRTYELLQDAVVVRRADRAKCPPKGLAGGRDGEPSRFVIGVGTSEERAVSPMGRYEMKAGDKFTLQSPGGGGYGDPKCRAADAIRQDIAEGYVSREAARAIHDYNDES
ncbi:MAG: hypothetical protein RLZ98_1866 [Pseudomonadota bacterium]|jgi:N-methylhydantoinase B